MPPTSDEEMNAAYDRGAVIGPNFWDRAPPDRVIGVVHDILGVAAQFGHRCF